MQLVAVQVSPVFSPFNDVMLYVEHQKTLYRDAQDRLSLGGEGGGGEVGEGPDLGVIGSMLSRLKGRSG